ncbi:MAG: hypothetical protein SVK08_01170 [Halobacteriota archaeon]|nr:hypothetical protein [Halobacteriota archaeon]
MISKATFEFLEKKITENYEEGEIQNIGELEARALEWLEDEDIDVGERTWRDTVHSTTYCEITFENGVLSIDHEITKEIEE